MQFLDVELHFRTWMDDSIIDLIDVLAPGCKRLAVQRPIRDDRFRTPQVELLFGHSSVVQHRLVVDVANKVETAIYHVQLTTDLT